MRHLLTTLIVLPLAVGFSCGGDAKKGDATAGDKKPGDAKTDAAKTGDAKKGDATKGAPEAAPEAGNWDWQLPAGLDAAPTVPDDNPMSTDKVALGHKLFMDKRLSGDGSRSCYSCHQNQLGNADGRPKALGAGDKPLTRNTPTIWNVAYLPALYWDGRAASLEKQAVGAIKGGNMGVGADNLQAKADEIGKAYRGEFEKSFGLEEGDPVTMDHVAMALSAYERTLLCGDSALDKNAMDEAATRGYDLFRGKASCTTCHNGPNISDGLFHSVGVGFDDAGKPVGDDDVGNGKPAGAETENYKFKTPTLRNVAHTAPYFHDGSVATLEEAVTWMAKGGNPKAPNFDTNLRDTGLTAAEIADIVAFLQVLDCPGQLELIGDQTVAGIGDAAG